jgi:hypothetical protein
MRKKNFHWSFQRKSLHRVAAIGAIERFTLCICFRTHYYSLPWVVFENRKLLIL